MSSLAPIHPHPRLAPTLAGLLVAGSVHAQKLEPGLWELTSRGSSADAAMAQMQSGMANMTPEQRQMVEQMMARQGVGIGAKPNAMRVCISPEEAARAEPPPEAGCRHEVLQRSADAMKMRFECAGPPPSKGEAEYRFAGPKAYTAHTVVETVHDGQPRRMEMDRTGRWISADCGAIKPRGSR